VYVAHYNTTRERTHEYRRCHRSRNLVRFRNRKSWQPRVLFYVSSNGTSNHRSQTQNNLEIQHDSSYCHRHQGVSRIQAWNCLHSQTARIWLGRPPKRPLTSCDLPQLVRLALPVLLTLELSSRRRRLLRSASLWRTRQRRKEFLFRKSTRILSSLVPSFMKGSVLFPSTGCLAPRLPRNPSSSLRRLRAT